MISDSTEKLGSEIFFHKIEVGLSLPIDQVARMKEKIYILLGPRDGIAKRLLLTASEGFGADSFQLQTSRILVGIRLGEMGI